MVVQVDTSTYYTTLRDLFYLLIQGIISYIKSSYQNDPLRVVLELFLLFFAFGYLGMKQRGREEGGLAASKLTEKEIDELIEEWQPEPLVPVDTPKTADLVRPEHLNDIQGRITPRFLSSNDFLGLRGHDKVRQAAQAAIRKYGVGTCGPSGFYGTLDIHLELQDRLAKMLGTESALILSQGYSAVTGVIPAFAKRNDVLVVDDACCFAIQRGVTLSRSSHVYWFKHNDIQDLRRILQTLHEEHLASRKRSVPRRFICVEGVYGKTGNIVPLPEVVALAEEFKYRIFLDDTNAFGSIGDIWEEDGGSSDSAKNVPFLPRGTFAFYGMNPSQYVIIVASMSGSIGTCGGFSAGCKEVIDHQILNNKAYCFSASLPALFAAAALTSFQVVQEERLFLKLRRAITEFNELYFDHWAQKLALHGLMISGAEESPLRFLQASIQSIDVEKERVMLKAIREGLTKGTGKWVAVERVLAKEERPSYTRPAIVLGIRPGIDWQGVFQNIAQTLSAS